MNDPSPYLLGIDIGVTNVKWACVSPDGEVLDQYSFATATVNKELAQDVRELVWATERERGPAQAIGVAGPGIAAADGRSIWWMQGRLDSIQDLNWTEFLSRPTRVPVVNDAQAALMGEAWVGAAAGCKNVMLLTLGTGVGGALMVDGHLLRGHLGRAGHLGHVCLDPDGSADIVGMPGSLENAIGNCTIEQRTNGRFTGTYVLVAAHLAGDAEASAVWLRSVRLLACGIASLINVADPEIVVIGGGIARAGAALFDPLRSELDRIEWRPHGRHVRVVQAVLGEHAGAIGAARLAREGEGLEMA